ncbi:MAG: hypothetical protein KatS3mg110_1997 [Pirellulaceae bacterium]|nr:MAG: hypothetical protein KatS3mg110_1997 [Pirellulaceae bacterium]
MGFAIYEMPAVQEAPATYRTRIRHFIDDLRRASRESNSFFIPHLKALGQGWFKKPFGPYRLVARLVDIRVQQERVPVLVLVDFLQRHDTAYCEGKAERLEQRYSQLVASHRSKIEEAARIACDARGSVWPCLPPVPAELETWLAPVRPRERVDTFFLHANFCASYYLLELDSHKAAVYAGLCDIENCTAHEEYDTLLKKDVNGIELFYVRLRPNVGKFHHVLMLGLLPPTQARRVFDNERRKIMEVWELVDKRVLTLAPRVPLDVYHDALSQLTERAFPGYLLADERLWQSLWNPEQREVFLPLSSEECRQLEELLAGDCLPAVIEGRAGSGKTTLLIYYTAERCAQSKQFASRILYLTQSRNLLRTAAGLINRICQRLVAEGEMENHRATPVFSTYHDFALKQLSAEHRSRFQHRTRQGGWIDFSRFTDLLRGHGDPRHICTDVWTRSRECNPEAVWFVLRSYIKGYKISAANEDRWMTAEEYRESEDIPQRDRQVSADFYDNVWNRIWPWYKRLTVPCSANDFEPPFWDDLDLAWQVLLHRREDAEDYAVLICDEVQDLTRLELATLLRSLAWLKYDLQDLFRRRNGLHLPIILAGDAHQTINPSVFRWARVRSDLAETLVENIPNLTKPRIRGVELRFNYRNAQSIGQLCNALQLLRQEILGRGGNLQQLWRTADRQPNQRIRRLIISGSADLENMLQQGILIIGPEDDDPALEHTRSFWKKLGYDRTPDNRPNYVVPAEIKGLEHDFVAIAGFGVLWALWLREYRLLADFWNWQNAVEDATIPEALRFLTEYFLNRLYVAASRSREQLWIIETDEGWNAFWSQLDRWISGRTAQPPAATDTPLGAQHDTAACAFVFSDGDIHELMALSRRDWPYLAEEFEKLAYDQRNPHHAERSAFYYDRAGRPVDRDRMLAYKLYYENSILEAANRMLPIKADVASDWFWEAAAANPDAWNHLTDERIQPDWRRRIAHAMAALTHSSPPTPAAVHNLAILLQEVTALPRQTPKGDESQLTWDALYIQLVSAALHLPQPDRQVQTVVLDLARRWTPEPTNSTRYCDFLAQLAFQLAQYSTAAEYWEQVRRDNHKDYFVAKAHSTPYPNCLRWWDSAGDYHRVLMLFDQFPNTRLGPDDRRRVARAADYYERWPTVFVMLAGLENRLLTEKIWARVLASFRDVPDLSAPVAELVLQVHHLYQQLERVDFVADWTHFLFDLIVEADKLYSAADTAKRPALQQIIRGVVAGFSLDSDANVLRHRIRGSWETRKDPDSNWAQFVFYLSELVKASYDIFQSYAAAFEADLQQRAGKVATFALSLLWYFDRRERASAVDVQSFLQSHLREYAEIPESEAKRSISYVENIAPELRDVACQALRIIGEAPRDWIRSHEHHDDRSWRILRDIVDALGFDLYASLRATMAAAQTEADIAPFEWWLTVGKFIEQVPFRRLARDFYDDLAEFADEQGWSDEQREIIRQRLSDYHMRYRQWQDTRYGRDSESGRASHRIVVNPGETRRGATLEVRNLAAGSQAIIEFLSTTYRSRFFAPKAGSSIPEIRAEQEIDVFPPEIFGSSVRWLMRSGEQSVQLEWDRERHLLVIRTEDQEFHVLFVRVEEARHS